MNFNWTVEITDIFTTVFSIGISALLLFLGWKNDKNKDRENAKREAEINRDLEIAKELRIYRINMLKEFVKVAETNDISSMSRISCLFELYGQKKEIDLWKQVCMASKNNDKATFEQTAHELQCFVTEGIRKELNIEKI